MVYILNAQDCYQSPFQLATVRNRLFTAITRSKAWVRVLGVGDGMDRLIKEFEQIKQHDFKLAFRYPGADRRKQLNIVNRDMSATDQERRTKSTQQFASLLADLEAGKLFIEDLPKEQVNRLKEWLGARENR